MTLVPAQTSAEIAIDGLSYRYYSLRAAKEQGLAGLAAFPYCLKILAENLLRQCAGGQARAEDLTAFWRAGLDPAQAAGIAFRPLRVMMDDTAGLPLLGELAAMRDAQVARGKDARTIDPAVALDFIVDHSVVAEHTGRADAVARNMALEFAANHERFRFLRWADQAFAKLRVFPPGSGICHQINLEHLAQVVAVVERDGERWLHPDSMAGIDSHTPMINALGIVGWGVSGMEGLAAALGEPIDTAVPEVVGVRLAGALRAEVNATDLVLTLTKLLRERDLIGKVVEYFGPGLDTLSVPDRATVANMTPECGATMSYFPIDRQTLRYLRSTGRAPAHLRRVEVYARAQGLWHDETTAEPAYREVIDFDLADVRTALAGPGQPHYRLAPADVPAAFARACPAQAPGTATSAAPVRHGDVVIAAITSCTNTSNPEGMIAAGLLARNARARGLSARPWVKTSLSPGSRVVADYLCQAGLQDALDALGFHVAGYGCMSCVGFSGSLAPAIADAIATHGIATAAVTSGNRNYDGRVHVLARANFLASPMLVVAYALAGSVREDIEAAVLGHDQHGKPVRLQELLPQRNEVRRLVEQLITPELFHARYATVARGQPDWQALQPPHGPCFPWDDASTVLCRPASFDEDDAASVCGARLEGARILAIFGDMANTEHISPMGPIPPDSLAADYLRALGVTTPALGSFAARRLNAQVMERTTYASPHLRNEMLAGSVGGRTLHHPSGETMAIFDAACRYRQAGVPLVVVAGKSYGAGSSRDWAARGPRHLGVKAIVAESFERIHRANLVAAGVLPLQFMPGENRASLALHGDELVDIEAVPERFSPGMTLGATLGRSTGAVQQLRLALRLESARELALYRHGGMLRYLLAQR